MNKSYAIIVTPDAEINLIDIWEYITFELQAPDTADAYVDRLTHDTSRLDHNPYRHELAPDEPWRSRGVRRFLSQAFWIYYLVDEERQTVRILNYILSRRDQLKALSRGKCSSSGFRQP